MKIAVQLALLPGKTIKDQVKWAKDHGVEGLELHMKPYDELRAEAGEINGGLPITTVCGNCDVKGVRSFDFLDPDLAKRRASIAGSKAILKFCGEVGATGQIVPPIFGPPVVPDLSPVMDPVQIEEHLMVAACQELGPWAAEQGTLFMLEPLNRYEQHYLRQQADGVRVIRKAKVKGLGLLSDLFHMHIEEVDIPKALESCGKYISHVHLADNTRLEPGSGDIDFVAAFKVLHQVRFEGYMAYECGIRGRTPRDRAQFLAKSLDYMRQCINRARK